MYLLGTAIRLDEGQPQSLRLVNTREGMEGETSCRGPDPDPGKRLLLYILLSRSETVATVKALVHEHPYKHRAWYFSIVRRER